MLHPLEHVRDHQNPLTDAPALASRQAPQLGRPRFAAKEVCRHRPPQTWYAALLTLPHLEITGSRYKPPKMPPVTPCDTPGVTLLFKFMTLQRAPISQAPRPVSKPSSVNPNGFATLGLANAAAPVL